MLYAPVTWVTGVLYTIPSLALFALLVPITGLTMLTAEIGLVSYTLLILVRNIVGGLRGVPPEVREAAIGMGYSRWQHAVADRTAAGDAGDHRRGARGGRDDDRPGHGDGADRPGRARASDLAWASSSSSARR